MPIKCWCQSLFQGVAQAAISANHGYLLIPGGPGASDVYRWLGC